jgi:hypothetical protein
MAEHTSCQGPSGQDVEASVSEIKTETMLYLIKGQQGFVVQDGSAPRVHYHAFTTLGEALDFVREFFDGEYHECAVSRMSGCLCACVRRLDHAGGHLCKHGTWSDEEKEVARDCPATLATGALACIRPHGHGGKHVNKSGFEWI